jgi:acyl-ACP thioesterase
MATPNQKFHQEEFRIRNYEVGPDGQVTIQSIFSYLVEGAGNHAVKLGVSLDDLFAQGQTWVLSRLHLKMDSFPRWPGTIRLETWPSGRKQLFALRDLRLSLVDGPQLGVACTSWMIIDWRSRRPTRIPAHYDDFVDPARGRALASDFHTLPKPERSDGEATFQVRWSDLDLNQHVYAAHYLNWAIESIPEGVRRQYHLSELEVAYRAECVYGDKVTAWCQVTDIGNDYRIIHNLQHSKTGKEFTRLVTHWRQRTAGGSGQTVDNSDLNDNGLDQSGTEP